MKYLMILTVGVCLLFSAVPAVAQNAADEAAVRKAAEQTLAAWNAHDATAYAAILDDVYEDWGGTIQGRAATEKYQRESFERAKDSKLEILEELGIVFVTPDVAIYKYRAGSSGMIDADGKPTPPAKSISARVLVKRNGKWLLAALFFRAIEE